MLKRDFVKNIFFIEYEFFLIAAMLIQMKNICIYLFDFFFTNLICGGYWQSAQTSIDLNFLEVGRPYRKPDFEVTSG